jgi:hypothetical protein
MLRFTLVACLLLASAANARPMLIHESQFLYPPAGSNYYFFGSEVDIDGDWAIVTAATPSPSPQSPEQTNDALLYRRVNGQWIFDRILVHRVSTVYGQSTHFQSVAMKNGVVAIGSNPTRIFKRTNNTWTEIAHPFSAPEGHPNHVFGSLEWDGNTLLASQRCLYGQQPWGALISRLNADGSWTPLQRISSGDTFCDFDPYDWAISGDTVVVPAFSNDYEVAQDQMRIFRRSGTTWVQTSVFEGADGDVRGDELFVTNYYKVGTLVYRNDDTRTLLDRIRIVSESHLGAGPGYEHTEELFARNRHLFRKNTAGKYEHVATLASSDGGISLGTPVQMNGRRAIAPASSGQQRRTVAVFDLPTTFTPSEVVATGFEDGVAPVTPQLGTFTVATTGNGNRVYRQSSLTGEYRALIGDADWQEQSIEAVIRPIEFDGSDRWAGLAVRYQDDANYYYATLRSSGVMEIKRRLNGVYSTLARATRSFVAGRNYHVALQTRGNLIALRIDGKDVMSGGDDQIPRGRTALLGYRTAVDYDNIVAAQVGQQPINDLEYANCFGSLTNMPEWSTNGTGTWNCSNPGVAGTESTMQQTSTSGFARALVGTPTDDQVVTTRVRRTAVGNGSDPWLGVIVRYVDESNYYYLTLRNSNTVSLRKLVNGVITELATAPYALTTNAWYGLRLEAVGSELRAFINGEQILQAADSSHPVGQGGIMTNRVAGEFQRYYAWQP